MQNFSKAQHIPECFHQKVLLDERVSKIKSHDVVSFLLFRRLKAFQDTARFRCMEVIKRSRDPRGGAAK